MYSNGKRLQIHLETDFLVTGCHCSQKLDVFLQAQKMGRGPNQKKYLETEGEVATSLSKAAFLQCLLYMEQINILK